MLNRIRGSIVIVLSPPSALRKDFRKTSVFVLQMQTKKMKDVIHTKYQLVYVSPEQLIGNPMMCQSTAAATLSSSVDRGRRANHDLMLNITHDDVIYIPNGSRLIHLPRS